MTFKEKLQMECPNEICKGVPSACPTTYGYEKYEDRPCKGKELIDSALCDECWNREMPNTELVKTVTLPMPPNTEPKNEIDAADYINIYTEGHGKGYTEGLNDAWELAEKIWNEMGIHKRDDVFGFEYAIDVMKHLTPQEALAKLKAYEERIEVGDVVEAYEKKFVIANITRTEDATTYFGIARDGMLMCSEEVKKTGKHIDIKSILDSIGE